MALSKKKNNHTRQSNRAASLYLHYKGEIFKMPKIGTQKTITVEGQEYILQHPGTREFIRIQDRIMTENGVPSNEKLAEELFKHVIVDPKVSWEYFDEHDGFEEVFQETMSFLRTGK
ncbi:hypothetical protein WD019_15195 [Fictibacillus sp. Mic-4]|uniref:hypothetical protein n=1 Tax=Fictibacillus sp. Mic-4 TaxID=3132826 RepID=UPI003CEA0B39